MGGGTSLGDKVYFYPGPLGEMEPVANLEQLKAVKAGDRQGTEPRRSRSGRSRMKLPTGSFRSVGLSVGCAECTCSLIPWVVKHQPGLKVSEYSTSSSCLC